MQFPNSIGHRNHPRSNFATASSAMRDFDRKNMMRDRGIIYKTNGGGRDTYIFNDAGGFNKMYEPRSQFHPGTLLLPDLTHKKFFERQKQPYLHSKPIQYNDDGSGRDTYVKSTNGGLSNYDHPNRMREFRQAFVNGLRQHDEIPSQQYLEMRQTRNQVKSMARTNGMKIISEPWVVSDDRMGATPKQTYHNSPSLRIKNSPMNAGLFNNPEEVELASPSKPHKTGMQGVLSNLIDQKANNRKPSQDQYMSSLGMMPKQDHSQRTLYNKNANKSLSTTIGKGAELDVGIKFQKSSNLSRTFAQTPSRQKAYINENNKPVRQDFTNDIGRYIKQLDSRLSIPKFTKESELTDQQKLYKIGVGIKNEQNNQLRKSKQSSGSISPRKSARQQGATNNALLLHQLSGGDLTKFIKKTSRINSTERGNIAPGHKDIEAVQMLASVDSGKLIIHKSQMEREKSRKHIESLKKIPIEQRERLFESIKKGQNRGGGVFGGSSPDREPSPSKVISSKNVVATKDEQNTQRYQHSQRDPIIIRGGQNVDVNHLVLRKKEFR